MSCIEETTCDIDATFRRRPVIRRPGHCVPSLRPWCDTSRQSAQLWISQSPECRTTSPNWECNYVSSTMYPECSPEDCRGKPCWLNPRESAQRSSWA